MERNYFLQAAATILLLTGSCLSVKSQSIDNPVITKMADCGVLRYAGKYYLGGLPTNGDFLISEDLVHWDRRVHVFDLDNEWTHGTGARNNQIHSDDISFINGTFHLLFSANYWGKDKHIVHTVHAVSPSPEGRFEEPRKDRWFENRIDPMAFQDEDGQVYLYLVKFTDGNAIWGRPMDRDFRFTGDARLLFSSRPGSWETMDNRVIEGPFVIKYRGRYHMLYNTNHTSIRYGNYRLGAAEATEPLGFNEGNKRPGPVVEPNTVRFGHDLVDLIRYGTGQDAGKAVFTGNAAMFRISIPVKGLFALFLKTGGPVRISLNGTAIHEAHEGLCHTLVTVPDGVLREGENYLRVSNPAMIMDLGLYDFAGEQPDDIFLTPGQPNIVRGPNGLEWWLVYMANKNSGPRSQFINRIHFTGGHLTVDGITGKKTPGYHPCPARPFYGGKDMTALPDHETYVFEATFTDPATVSGITAWQSGTSRIDIGIDRSSGKGFVRSRLRGRSSTFEVPLPYPQKADRPHLWRIENNAGKISAWIDGILLCDRRDISLPGPGHPAILNPNARTEYVTYTIGWDEWDGKISGWESGSSESALFKGPAACAYEFSACLRSDASDNGPFGIYAAYSDPENYCLLKVDPTARSYVIECCEDGHTERKTASLERMLDLYPDPKYSDSWEKQYRFPDGPVCLDKLELPFADFGMKDTCHPDPASLFEISYLSEDRWHPLEYTVGKSTHPAWQQLNFKEISASALSFINRNPVDANPHISGIKAGETLHDSYQFRVLREGKDLYLWLNDRPVRTCTLPADRPSRIGIYRDRESPVKIEDSLYYVK